jgi:hypothetical protein
MKVWSLAIFGLVFIAQVNALGSSCGVNTYFTNPGMTVNPTPAKGTTSTFTLTGTTPIALILNEWDIYVNFNGAVTNQFDVPVTGNYTVNSPVSVSYKMVNSASAQSGYYTVRFMLQNSNGYYINCWTYSYYLVG